VIVEIRRFLCCDGGVSSFSLSESTTSTRPSGGGRSTIVKTGSK
jgi:hypothetical protein